MHSVHLEIFREIQGIGSASGIIYRPNLLYIIGDNSGFLNEYNIKDHKLRKIQILSGDKVQGLENISKARKPDFEVLCQYADQFYILGSGSTAKRNSLIEFEPKSGRIIRKDLTDTYRKMKAIANLDDDNLNIEGAVFTGKDWVLFNRGNGSDGKNGTFRISHDDLAEATKIEFKPIRLPNIKHVESTFTDAVMVNDAIFFISTAEDTKSTYADGEILGSFIGSIDLKSLTLNFSHRISGSHKFEGISLYQKTSSGVEFLLCEDRDTAELKTVIYKIGLSI